MHQSELTGALSHGFAGTLSGSRRFLAGCRFAVQPITSHGTELWKPRLELFVALIPFVLAAGFPWIAY